MHINYSLNVKLQCLGAMYGIYFIRIKHQKFTKLHLMVSSSYTLLYSQQSIVAVTNMKEISFFCEENI